MRFVIIKVRSLEIRGHTVLGKWRRRSALTALVTIVTLTLAVLAPAQASPTPTVTVGLTPGQNITATVTPQQPATMQWQVSCSGADCQQAAFTVALPWPLQAVVSPTATPGREESFDANTGVFQARFVEGLPDGSLGLPNGAVRQVPVQIALAGDGAVDGQNWPLTARINATGAAEALGYGSVTAVVPPPPEPEPSTPATPEPAAPPTDPAPASDPGSSEEAPSPEPQPSEPETAAPDPDPSQSQAPPEESAPGGDTEETAPTDEPEATESDAPVRALAASIGVSKTANETTVQPGQEFAYTLVNSCSSLTNPCLDFTLVDVLPAEFEVTSLPQSNNQRTVTFDAGTRTLTVQYIIPVAGGSGLPAGGSQSFQIGMRLPQQTAVTDGTVIPNTAQVTALDADPKESRADIEAEIPIRPEPVATKQWNPDTAVAQSGDLSTISLGVRNASSSSTPVTELLVTDDSADTFNSFNVTDAGSSVVFPAGTDQVVVEACTQPAGTCTEADYLANASGPQGAAPLVATVPVDQITGLRYRFSSSTGANLPFSADPGTVTVGVQLRDADRTTGTPIEPVSKQTVRNCAVPALVVGERVEGEQACKNFSIVPNGVVAGGDKTIFPDNNGSYRRNGFVVVGQNSGVTMKITAQNKSEVSVGVMTFIEPAPNSAAEFDKLDITQGRFNWPSGASEASMTVLCRSGSSPAPIDFTKTANQQSLPSFGCDPGVYPASIELELRSAGGGSVPTIPVDAKGSLELHGIAARVDGSDVADGLTNCADVKVGITGGASEGTAQPCATTPVGDPSPGIGNRVKNGFGVQTIVPGQPNPMRIAFRNTGNVPVTNVIIEDPKQSEISGASNPFQYVYLDSIVLPRNIASTLQLWDPQAAGGAGYVDVVPGTPEFDVVKKRALGFRIVVTGSLQPGQTFGVNFEVLLRDDTSDPTGPPPDWTTFRNCAYIGIGAVTNRAVCSDEVTVKRDGEYAFNMLKRIVSGSMVRPGPGVPEQRVQVRHEVRNTGTFDLKKLVVIDRDTDFFDAVIFDGRANSPGNIDVNYPVGANRVQVDVCVSAAECTNDVWVLGTVQDTKTPRIPGSVAPADVKGVRVTFTASGGGPLLPSTTQPTSSACPDANVCFGVVGRQYLDGTTTPIPDNLLNTSEAAAIKPDSQPLQPLTADASVSVVPGDPELRFAKGPNSRIGPGESAPFVLEATNSGTAPVNDIVVADPLPDNLTFDATIGGGAPGTPYVLEYTLPTGYPAPTTVDFRQIRGGDADAPPGCTDVNRVCKVTWSFPGYALPPGGIIKVTFNVTLSPGTLAGQTIVNTAGASGSTQGGTANVPCDGSSVTDDPAYGEGTYCTDPANVTSVAGDNFLAEKWIKADPNLGLLNAAGQVVPVGDPQCPLYANGSDTYTRFPCVARVLPGGTIDYLIRGVNSGTNPTKEVVVLDGLPVQGDNGVLLTNEPRGTQWDARPTMLTPVTNVEGYPGVSTGYTDSPYMSGAFCRAAIQPPPNDVCPPGSFGAGFSPAATGFQTRFEFPDDRLLAPGQSFTLTWSMKAPATLATTLPEPIAWNSFALRPTFRQSSGQLTTLPATEPLKVGVAMPMSAFTIDKTVVGLPQGVNLDDYGFEYRCTVGAVEVASGSFTIAGSGSWTSPLIPASAQCRVWESQSQGGTSSAPDEAGALVIDMSSQNRQGTISNSYESGALQVSKRVTWDDVPPISVNPVSVTVSCSFPVSSNVLPGFPDTVVLADGDSKTYGNLPVGSECTVTETDTSGATQVILTPSNASPIQDNTGTVTVDGDNTAVLIENIYETGGLRIVKRLDGAASQWAQGPFEFEVNCRRDGLPDLDYTVTLSPGTGLSETISPIPANYVCTVAETNIGDASSSVVDPNVVTIPEYPIGGQPPGPAVVNSTNTFPGGWIEVTKTVSGNAAGQMVGATFEAQVQCERDVVGGGTQVIIDETFPIVNGETVAIGRVDDASASPPFAGQIPLQARCWVTETDSVGATQVINPHPQGSKATIDSPTGFAWNLDNVFTGGGDGKGSIKVLKTVTGPASAYAGDFEFLAECSVGGFAIADQKVTISPSVSLEAYFTGIPVGATCDISETSNGGASGTVPVDLGQVTVPAEGQPAVEVEATNDFPAGYVSVEKELTGGAAGVMAGAEFTVRVQCERDLPAGGSEQILDTSVTLRGGQQVDVPDPLPIGARCWIEETNSVGATSVTLSNDVDNKAVVTSQSPDLVLTATNEYIPGGVTPSGGGNVPAGISVTKTLTGSASKFAQGPFVFTANCSIAGYTLQQKTLTLTPTELVGYFTGLPVGTSCDLAETENGSSPGPVPVDLGTVVVPANGAQTVAVGAVNDFPGAVITVSKKVVGAGTGPFAFEVDCEGIDAKVDSFSLRDAQSRRITVPVGAVCTVKETQNGGAATTTFLPGGRGTSTTVTVSGNTAIEVTNEFPAAPTPKPKPETGGGSGNGGTPSALAATGGSAAPQLLLWSLGLIAAGVTAVIVGRRGKAS